MPTEFGVLSLIYIFLIIAGLVIFYYIIKSAVKNGILAANEEQNLPTKSKIMAQDPYTPEQIELMRKYEKNEITIEEYKQEWDRLKNK